LSTVRHAGQIALVEMVMVPVVGASLTLGRSNTMVHDPEIGARVMSSLVARRKLLKMAGGAAGIAAFNPSLPSALAAQTPAATPAAADPEALSNGGTVPAPPGYDLPIAEPGTVTFRVATSDNGYAPRSYTQGLEVWAEIEKRTGVKVAWEVTPSAQYNDVMSVRIGAASDLPDIVSLPTSIDPVGAGQNNIAIPLGDLIDQHAPNIKAFFDEFPDARRLMTAPDGEIYALSSVVTDAAYADAMGIIYREDWRDQLGIAEPTTLDEWYTMLKRFKTDILEANGVTDVAPMMGGNSNLFGAIMQFGHALGLHPLYSQGWHADESGKVEYEFIDDRFKELIGWFNKLYSEKLLDPRFYTSTHEDRTQLVTTNHVGVDADFINRATEWGKVQAQAGVTDAKWVMAVPPVSEQYPDPYYELYGPLSGWYSITPKAKQPELAIQWLDYVWASDEGNTLVSYGLENLTYTVGDDKRLLFTDWVTKNPQGLDPNSALRYYGAMPYFVWIRANRGPLSEQAWDITRINPAAEANAKKVGPYLIPSFPKVLPTAEESKETAGILADLTTFQQEAVLKMVLGQDDLESGWKKYLSTMQDLGVDRLIEIKQTQYDRYSAS